MEPKAPLLNERLISNALDLLQSGPTIVVFADRAKLAGCPDSCRDEGKPREMKDGWTAVKQE